MASEFILFDNTDGIATLTLNRPDRKNSLGPELVAELAARLTEASTDDSVRAIVLTNVGNTFCAGADLKAAAPGVASSGPKASFVDVFNLILESDKPVVGRIDGHATGGGVGLVAACDLSVMRNDALVGFTEVRIGVAPAIISVVCLPKLRRGDASELFLTGERISADRAADVGLINRSVEPDQLNAEIDRYLGLLRQGGPNALAASKQLIRAVPAMPREEAFAWTERRSAELFRTDEATAGIAAFRARTPAPWV